MVNFFKAYSNPDKYSIDLPLKKIVAVDKVDIDGIQRIMDKVKSEEPIKTIVVVKHPEKEYFAVLDGHHRFWALKKLGMPTIKCAIVEDQIGLGFYLTKKGVFQPNPKITRYIRIPLKRFNQYITNFIKAPEKLIEKQKKFKKSDK